MAANITRLCLLLTTFCMYTSVPKNDCNGCEIPRGEKGERGTHGPHIPPSHSTTPHSSSFKLCLHMAELLVQLCVLVTPLWTFSLLLL
ncbi:hypothetical protein EMCRGX_G025230 [Ephydatia muelleri]